jgi:2-oxoglutarate dehydrogenase E2 component (dihydrolipoamide succinyltransferase)
MKVNVTVPQLGESVVEGIILEWYKKEGDLVKKDEALFVLSTDKVNAEVPAPVTGRVSRILVKEGETVPVGRDVAVIETEVMEAEHRGAETPAYEDIRMRKPQEEGSETETQKQREPEMGMEFPRPHVPAPPGPTPGISLHPRVSSLARTIAEKEGIPLEEIKEKLGGGPKGRIMKQDVLAELEVKKKVRDEPEQPLSREDTLKARKLLQESGKIEVESLYPHGAPSLYPSLLSAPIAPHATALIEVDMTDILRYLEKDRREIKLTHLPFVLTAVVKALHQFPILNASLERDTVTFQEVIHLGVTIPLEKGSVTPVIREADGLNLLGISRAIDDLTHRAQARLLEPEELQGGTFTVSNSGAFGVIIDTPIIHPSQVAVLGIGAIKKRPIVIRDKIEIRFMIYASLSYDYRVVDSVTAAQFMQTFTQSLEMMDLDPLK